MKSEMPTPPSSSLTGTSVTALRSMPLPFVGYVFVLLGFVGLGLFTAALGSGVTRAFLLAIATVVAYGIAAACFLIRRYESAHPDPSSPIRLGVDPIRGNTDRRDAARYRQVYRGQTNDATPSR